MEYKKVQIPQNSSTWVNAFTFHHCYLLHFVLIGLIGTCRSKRHSWRCFHSYICWRAAGLTFCSFPQIAFWTAAVLSCWRSLIFWSEFLLSIQVFPSAAAISHSEHHQPEGRSREISFYDLLLIMTALTVFLLDVLKSVLTYGLFNSKWHNISGAFFFRCCH